MDNILCIDNVSKQFTGHKALDNVTLDIPRGSVYGLLGPNGAGKTTLLRIINHITAPDSGTVVFEGHPLTQDDVACIGYLPEERGLYKKMKVGEQALFFARLKGLSRQEATRELRWWFRHFDITAWWDRKVEELSKGMAQKVQFIVTVLHRPRLLIFDEPFSGFDPINAQLLKQEILRLRDEGSTVIFSTHNMDSVEALCEEITLINKSHNILSGRVDDIRRKFGAGRFVFTLGTEADIAAVIGRFGQAVAEKVAEDKLPDGSVRLVLKFAEGHSRKDIVAAANDVADLRAFSSDLPSMNEIFIRSVTQNNQSQNEAPQNEALQEETLQNKTLQ